MSRLFTADDAWTGGFYELAIEVGPRSNARLERLLEAIWSEATLDGCYVDRTREPSDQTPLTASLSLLTERRHLLGVATLPSGLRVPCGTVAIREEDGSDWLDLYLPVGALSGLDKRVGGFPFEEGTGSRLWREPMDRWLADVAERAFEHVDFSLALIGFEVSGAAHARDLREHGVPEQRGVCYLLVSEGKLALHSTNRWYTGPT